MGKEPRKWGNCELVPRISRVVHVRPHMMRRFGTVAAFELSARSVLMVVYADRRSTPETRGSRRFAMLDAFKKRAAGSKREVVLDERHELQRLIETARAERAAMDETLLRLRARSANLMPIGKSLEHITENVVGVMTKLEEIDRRLAALDGRTRAA